MKNIPPHWKKVKFKELAKEKSVRVDNPGESGYDIYVGLEHLDSGELVVKRYGSTSDVTSAMKLFSKNDILFARRNTYLRRVSVAPFDGVCSGDIIVIEPILEHIVEGFLPIFMQFEDFENKIIALSAGAFSKRIKWKQLAEEELVIPSIEEQKKMVEIIWSVQGNTEKNELCIRALENFKKRIVNKLLTKGIGHSVYKKTEHGEIPESWTIISLGKIVSLKKGKTNPPYKYEKYVSLENMDSDKIIQTDFSQAETVKSITNVFSKGDLLYGKLRPYLNKASIADFDGICSTEILVLDAKRGTSNDFLIHLFKTDSFIKYNTHHSFGTKMPRSSFEIISKYKIPLPPEDEQKEIVDIISSVEIQKKKLLVNHSCLVLLKKKLTSDFISGRIRIPEEALRNVQ